MIRCHVFAITVKAFGRRFQHLISRLLLLACSASKSFVDLELFLVPLPEVLGICTLAYLAEQSPKANPEILNDIAS